MKENQIFYIFGCFRYASAFLHKGNYKKHEPLHAEISGKSGLLEIEETLIHPDCITEYAEKNALDQVIKKTEIYYRKIAKRSTVQGKPVTDHWKAILVWNEHYRHWELASAFIRSSPAYAMINTRIETVVYKKA